MMQKLLYFAYGSNMLLDRIEDRCGIVKVIGKYVLQDWKLTFDCGHKTGAYSNIVEEEGAEVEGVLYDLTEKQVDAIDRYEGYPYNYERRYFKIDDNTIGYVYVSVADWFKVDGKPTLHYLNMMIDGCLQNGLDKTSELLLQYKKDNYDIENNKHEFKEQTKGEYVNSLNEYAAWRRKTFGETGYTNTHHHPTFMWD